MQSIKSALVEVHSFPPANIAILFLVDMSIKGC